MRVWWLIAVFAFLFDPMSACVGEPQFQYGDVEMRIAIEGTWKLSIPGGRELTVAITEASEPVHATRERGFVRAAAACGNRSFVRSAGACLDTSTMKLAVREVGSARVGTGELMVIETRFDEARLSFSVDDIHVEAHVSPIGQATQVWAGDRKGASLVRVSASSR